MKFFIAWMPYTDDWIVLTSNQVIEKSLSEDAATKLAQYLNTAEYLNTSPQERAKRHEKIDFDFDSLYEKYPRRIGKKTGLERLKKTITTIDKYNLFAQALINYVGMCEGKEEKYILHFSTFTSRWMDYLPEDSAPKQQSLSIDDISNMMNQ